MMIVSPLNTSNQIYFREIEERDLQRIKELHTEFFPVTYSDKFFIDAVQKRGISGAPLFSSIAYTINNTNNNNNSVKTNIHSSEHIIGFVLSQFLSYTSCEDSEYLFSAQYAPQSVCYILTLGLCKEYRRSGLGSQLIEQCIRYASGNTTCGAVSDVFVCFMLYRKLYTICTI
jgi:ribosomal protein S18 acetylase RimI-like enzyme